MEKFIFDDWDEEMMRLAIEQARLGKENGEVPVGAVLTVRDLERKEECFLAQGFNECIGLSDPSAHAEIQVFRTAGQENANYRLPGSVLYVSLEPCIMCVGAILHARVERVVMAALEPKTGAVFSNPIDLSAFPYAPVVWEYGLLADESVALLRDFFRERRQN